MAGISTRISGGRTGPRRRSSRNGATSCRAWKPPMPLEIVVDGTDSAGKTPCVEALCRTFGSDRQVRTCAPFRVQEVYPLWEREPRRAATIIRSIMDDFRRSNSAADLIIWDRGWPTVWVSTTDAAARGAMLPFP